MGFWEHGPLPEQIDPCILTKQVCEFFFSCDRAEDSGKKHICLFAVLLGIEMLLIHPQYLHPSLALALSTQFAFLVCAKWWLSSWPTTHPVVFAPYTLSHPSSQELRVVYVVPLVLVYSSSAPESWEGGEDALPKCIPWCPWKLKSSCPVPSLHAAHRPPVGFSRCVETQRWVVTLGSA